MKKRAVIALVALAAIAAGLIARYVLWPLRVPSPSPTEFVPERWERARHAPMHARHVGDAKITCTECHADGFDRPPELTTCARSTCHQKPAANAHHGSATLPTTCLSCHVFEAEGRAAACVDCHGRDVVDAGPVNAHHATTEATCTACHAPHGEKGARTRPADCTRCHANVDAAHGRLALGADGGTGLGADREDGAALCTGCHLPHRGKEEARARCASCHVERAGPAAAATTLAGLAPPHVEPRGKGVAGHPACVTCHAPHDARKADVRACASCHADHGAALSTKGHTACTQCHAPHAPGETAGSCAGCHAKQITLGADRVADHNRCASCHDPHRPAASKEAACAKCHGAVEPAHPMDRACVGCHAMHPRTQDAPLAAACSSCHTKAKEDRGGFHARGVACAACHKPHDFALASAKSGPTSLSASGAFCVSCHAGQERAVAPRAGHAVCTKCHGEPHAPSKAPTCSRCHGAEAASAPAGHATCTHCHDAHSGSLGEHASCTSCHGNKRGVPHANLPSGCQACHRPHGPRGIASPPPCASCHVAAKLPGLHAIAAHAADCRSCHSSHTPPRSDRATCTSGCHADRRGHQPAATLCKGCHLFR